MEDKDIEYKSNLLKGKTIELIFTNDPYTKLRGGDKGIIQRMWKNLDEILIDVKWFTGSNLSLIVGKDEYVILD